MSSFCALVCEITSSFLQYFLFFCGPAGQKTRLYFILFRFFCQRANLARDNPCFQFLALRDCPRFSKFERPFAILLEKKSDCFAVYAAGSLGGYKIVQFVKILKRTREA